MSSRHSVEIGDFQRTVCAAPHAVYAMFSRAEYLEQWFIPPSTQLIKSVLDFKVGGTYQYGMASVGRPEVWGRLDFVAIAEPNSVIFVQSVTDCSGRIIPPLAGSEWLLRMKSDFSIRSCSAGAVLTQEVSVVESRGQEQDFVKFMWKELSVEYEAALGRLAHIFVDRRS
ncbi:SRPBCC domain-containing protein [Sphingomonas sp. MG17]|uniref:SRPBCC domain-containing protein n=1 Tax=Sphingomonas tagetis TaxID=2949092 RepID=A0A9X2HFT2_9SPHN|nr:SRPBCC domain-containing protein [Sphingomonas tagetis]MCP3730321.1 SRPBCC domain-containing protein [Sphingomonas tagetis]